MRYRYRFSFVMLHHKRSNIIWENTEASFTVIYCTSVHVNTNRSRATVFVRRASLPVTGFVISVDFELFQNSLVAPAGSL